MTPSQQQPVGILLVEEHTAIRTALGALLDSQTDFAVVGEASDRAEALDEAARESPDVILIHPRHTGEPLLDLIKRLAEVSSSSRVILITSEQDPHFVRSAVRAGVMGIVSREQTAALLIRAIRKVHEGELWLERTLLAEVLGELIGPGSVATAHVNHHTNETFTTREREVIALVCEGLTSREIGERLFIGETTVRHRLTHIYKKLGLNSRLDLIKYAYDHGLLEPHNGSSGAHQEI